MRTLIAVLAAAAVFQGPIARTQPTQTPAERTVKSAFGIVSYRNEVLGTALSIGNGYYLTTLDAYERQPAPRRLLMQQESGRILLGLYGAIRKDGETRLALLRIGRTSANVKTEPVDLTGDGSVQPQEDVTIVGVPDPVRSIPDGNRPQLIVARAGKIVSVKRDAGRITEYEIASPLHEAFWGAAVLSSRGILIGVITKNANYPNTFGAVPTHRILEFLTRPDIVFPTPALKGTDRTEPMTLAGSAVHYLPGVPPAEVFVTLALADGSTRVAPITAKGGGGFDAAIPLLPTVKAPKVLTVVHTSGAATARFMMYDRQVTIGGRAVPLSRVKEIDNRHGPTVTLTDGSKLQGAVAGLNGIEFAGSGATGVTDIGSAEMIWVVSAEQAYAPVSYQLTVRLNGKAIGESLGTFVVGPPTTQLPPFTSSAQAAGAIVLKDPFQPAGSAFGLGKGRFLTTTHVAAMRIRNAYNFAIRRSDVEPRPIHSPLSIQREDPRSGLAIVAANIPKPETLSATVVLGSETALYELQPVQIVGAGRDYSQIASEERGTISATPGTIYTIHRTKGEIDHMEVTGDLHAGSGGAGVIDSQGRLVAMLDQPTPDGRFTAIPVSRIRAFLSTNKPAGK